MKKILVILSLIFISINLSAQDVVSQANDLYSNGNYEEAATLYQQAIDDNGASAQVYYNLGNSYYRQNRIASAILNYERALLLDPGNDDIRFNLEIAKLKTVDRIEPTAKFFLVKWYDGLQNSFSTNQWSYLAIACFIFLIVCLFLFFFSRKVSLKKLGFYAGLGFLVICVFANLSAYRQKKELIERNTAIIFTPTITIKSSPDASGTDLFILHEGTKVTVKDSVGEWKEIQTADGNVGWIKATNIEII